MKNKKHNIEFFKRVLEDIFIDYKIKMRINNSWKLNLQLDKCKDVFAKVCYDYKSREFIMYVNELNHNTIKSLEDSVIHEFWHILLTPYTNKTQRVIKNASKSKISNITKVMGSFDSREELLVRKFTKIITGLNRKYRLLEKQNRFLKKKLRENNVN